MTTNDLPNGGNRSVLVQTTLRVAETDDEIEIVSDRGIQTIASTIPTSDNQSFIPFLEFTPYSEIVKDSQKVLDLPRKAALQFNLENKTHKKSLSEINPKGVLKKSMSNTTLITDSDLLISQHIVPTMPKTKEEREIQTDLTVNPYILDEDTVANVCTQLSVQTSITFEPADSLSEITQALKKAIVHTKNCQAVVVDGKIVTNYVDPDMEKASKVTVSERLSTLTSKTDNTAITRAAKENVAEEQEETETPIDQEEKPPPKPVTHTVQTSVPVPLNMTEEEFEANVQRILDQTVRNVYEFMAKIVEMYEQSKDADGKYVETPLSKELRKQAMERRLTVDEADEEVEVSETPVVKDESENLENKPPPLAKSETAEDQPKKQPSTLDMVAGIIRGPKWIVQQTLNVDVKTGLPTPGKQQKIEEEPVEVGEEIAFDATATTIEFVPIDTDEAEKHFTPKKEPPKSEPEEGVVEGALGDTDQVQSQEKDESAEPIETGESTEAAKQEILPDQEKPEAEEEAGDTNVPSAVEDTTVDATQEEPQVEDVVGDENVLPTIDEEDVSTPQEATDAAAVEAPKEDEILQEEPKGDETPTGILEAERPETPPPSLVDLVESIGDSKVKPVADIPCECSRIHEAGAAPPSISQPAIRFEVTVLSDAKRKHEGAEGVIVQASVSRPDQDRATCKDMNINLSVTVGGQTFTPGDQLAIEGSSGIDIESCECPEDQDKEKFDQEEGQGSLPSASEDFEECICPEEESKPLTEEVPESEESKEEAEGETPTVTEEQTEAATEPLQEQVETYPEQAREAPKEEVEAATEEVTEPTEAKPDIAPTWKECQCETSELKPGTHMQTQTEIVAELPGEPSEKGEASAKHSIGSSFAECVCTESETQSEVVVDHPDEKVSTKSEPESFVECICSHSETKSSKVGSEKQSKVTISSPPSQPRAKPSGDQVVEKPEQSEKPSEVEIGPPTEYPDQTEVSIKEGSQKIKQESQEYLECGCRKTKSTSTIKKTVCICEDKSKTVKKESQEFLECGCRKQRPASPVKKPVCACADKPKPIPQESQEFLECGCRKQRPPSPIRNPICTCADTSKPVPPKESQEFLECGCKKMPKKSSLKESREILECTCRRRRSPSPPKESICTCKDKQEIGVPKMPSKSRSLGQKVCGCQTEQFPHQQPEELEKFRSEPITEQGLVDVGTCMGGDAPGPCKQKSAPLRAKESIPKKLNQTFSLPTQNVSTDYDTTEPATQKDICICPTPGKYDESIEEYIKKLISESITTRDPELIQTHAACIGPFLQKFAGKLGQQAEGVSGRPIKCTGDAEQQCSCSVQILYINDGNQPTDTAEKACTCAIPKEQVQQRQDAVEPVIAAKSCHCDIDNEPSPYLECMYQEDNDYSEMYMEELQSGDGFRLEKIESDKVTCECPDELPPVLMETDECRSNIEIPWLSIVLPPPGTIIIKPMREIKKRRCDCWELDLKDSVLSATEPPVDEKVEVGFALSIVESHQNGNSFLIIKYAEDEFPQKPRSPSKSPSKQSTESSSKKGTPKSPKSPSKQSSPPKSPSNQSKPTEEAESPAQLQETALEEEAESPDAGGAESPDATETESPDAAETESPDAAEAESPDAAEANESELPQASPEESDQQQPPPEESDELDLPPEESNQPDEAPELPAEQPEDSAEKDETSPEKVEEIAKPPRHPRPPRDSSSSGCSCSETEADECADEQLGDMHFVYDNPCFANCEPYMDPVYKLYPDDCDTYCGPFTEIHWSEILIPKKVRLRSVKKSKPTTGEQLFAKMEPPQKGPDQEKQMQWTQGAPPTGDSPASELEINIGFTEIASTFMKVDGGADSQVTVSEISTISDVRMQIKRCPKDYGVTLYMPTVGSQPFVAAEPGTEQIAGLMVAVEPFTGPQESVKGPMKPQPMARTNATLDDRPMSASMPNMSVSTLNSTEFRNTYPRAMNRPIAADYYPQGQEQMMRAVDVEQVAIIQDLSTPAGSGAKNPPCYKCGRKVPDLQSDPPPEAKPPDKIKDELPKVPEAEQPGISPIAPEGSYTCQPCKTYLSRQADYPDMKAQYPLARADYGNLSTFTVKSDDFRKKHGIPPPKYEDQQCAGLYTYTMPQMEERPSKISTLMAQNIQMTARESTSSPGVTKPSVRPPKLPGEEPQKIGSTAFTPQLVEGVGERKVCKATCKAKMKSERQSEEKTLEGVERKKKPCGGTCGKRKAEEIKTEPKPVEDLARDMKTAPTKSLCKGPCAQLINIQDITDKEMKSINEEIEKIKRKIQEMDIPELDNWRNVETKTCPSCMQDHHMRQYPAHSSGRHQYAAAPYMYPTGQYPNQYPYMPDYSMYGPSYTYPYYQSDDTEDMDFVCSCSRRRPRTRRHKKRKRRSSQSITSDISSISGGSKRSRGSKSSKSSIGSASSKTQKKGKRRPSSQTTVSGVSSVSAGSGRSSKGSASLGELTSYRRKSEKSTSQVSFQDTGCSTQTDTEPEVEIRVGKGPPRIKTKQNFKGFVSKDPHKNKFRVAVRISPSKLRTYKRDDADASSGLSQT